MSAADSRIASILGEWQERLDRGEDVDPERVISKNPELAVELRLQFKALSQMRHAVAAKKMGTRLRTLPIDRYGEFRRAGEGGMGIVYWAIDTDLNREVAFKVIRARGPDETQTAPERPSELTPPGEDTPDSRSFESLKQRFLQEAWITSGMAHPGIVPVYELGQTQEGVPYYTMRFIKGERTLATVIEETKDQPIEERLRLLEPFLKVCDTLRYAHSRSVIHRDLKPENIAIGEFGEVVLIDWGLAKLRGTEEVDGDRLQSHVQAFRDATDLKTIVGAMGTPGYMGPEGALGKSDAMDERSDVYSLGAMLFEILTGRLPFLFETFGQLAGQLLREDAPRAVDVDPSVPDALSDLCARCLARNMDQRPLKVEAISEVIRAWQQESAARREVRGLMREADTAMEGTAGLTGDALLRQLDRVTALSRRVLVMRPGHGRAHRILHDCEEIRDQAIEEREAAVRDTERHAKRRVLVRFAAAAVLVGLAGTAVAAVLFDRERREAQDAESRTAFALIQMEEERNEKSRLLDEVDAGRVKLEDALERVKAQSQAKQRALARAEAAGKAKDDALAKIQAERDAKARALEQLQAEQEAREAAEAEAVQERTEKLEGLKRSRALGLVSASSDAQEADPMRALLLAREAARVQLMPEVVTRLRDAIGASLERAHLFGHEAGVRSATFSPDGEIVVTASSDGTARLWQANGQSIRVLSGHNAPVLSACFSPDGKLVLTTSGDGTARLWDRKGNSHGILRGHTKPVTTGMWSPNGLRILTTSDDGTARLWNARGKPTRALEGHDGAVVDAAFSPKGDLIVTASNDKTARIWDLNGKARKTLSRHRGPVRSVRFSPSGHYVLTGSADGSARLWDMKGISRRTFGGHSAAVTTAVFSPTAEHVLTASNDGTARLWTWSGKRIATMKGHGAGVTDAAFSPSGHRIFTASLDRTARVWDVGGELLLTYRGHGAGIHGLQFASRPDRLLTASSDGTARIWSLDGEEVAVWHLGGPEAPPATAPGGSAGRDGASPTGDGSHVDLGGAEIARMSIDEGTHVLAGFTKRENEAFVVTSQYVNGETGLGRTGRIQRFDLQGHPTKSQIVPRAFAYSATGDQAVFSKFSASPNTAPDLYLLRASGAKIRLGQNLDKAVLSPSGRYILALTGTYEQEGLPAQAFVWDQNGRNVGKLKIDPGWVWAFALSPTGKDFFIVSDEGVANLWSLSRRAKVATFPNVGTRINWAGFSPSGEHLLVVPQGRPPLLVDTKTRTSIRLMESPVAAIHAAFSPRGDRIATAGRDGTAALWDLDGSRLVVLRGHHARLNRVAFSNSGTRVITASNDWTARVWDLNGNELAVIAGHKGAVQHAAFSNDGEVLLTVDANSARLWRLDVQAPETVETVSSSRFRAVVSPLDLRVVTCAGDRTPRLWDSRGLLTELQGYAEEVADVMFAKSGETIVGISDEGAVRRWNMHGKMIDVRSCPAINRRKQGIVRLGGAFAGDDRLLIQLFGSAWIWNYPHPKIEELRGHQGPVLSVALSPNRNRALTTSEDGTARLWNANGTLATVLRGHGGPVQTGAFSVSGDYIATAAGPDLHLWAKEGAPLVRCVGHDGRIHAVSFSDVGDLVLTASADGTARVWDLEGRERAVLRGHGWDVVSAVFSPKSDRILTASKDKTARIWDLQGNELAVLRGHDSWVTQALFLPLGHKILTCSEDGTARVWLADADQLLKLAKTRCLRQLTAAEVARYGDLLEGVAGER